MPQEQMPERMTVGRIEQLTVSPEMKSRWEHNVQLRIATGKTINTSCVLAAQAKIDMLEVFLEEARQNTADEVERGVKVARELESKLSALAERVERAEGLLKEAQTLLNDAVKNGCLILGRCELDSRISSFLHDGTKGEGK